MNRSAHASSEVGWAGVEESKTRVEHEVTAGFGLDGVTDDLDTSDETVEHSANISSCKGKIKSPIESFDQEIINATGYHSKVSHLQIA